MTCLEYSHQHFAMATKDPSTPLQRGLERRNSNFRGLQASKQVACDDLDSLPSNEESKTNESVAGQIRNIFATTVTKIGLKKKKKENDDGDEDDEEEEGQEQEGNEVETGDPDDVSIMSDCSGVSKRSFLQRTASGLTTGLQRGALMVRRQSQKSLTTLGNHARMPNLIGKEISSTNLFLSMGRRDDDESSASSLGSLNDLDDPEEDELKAKEQNANDSDEDSLDPSDIGKPTLTALKTYSNYGEEKVNRRDKNTVWVSSDSQRHLQLNVESQKKKDFNASAASSLNDSGSLDANDLLSVEHSAASMSMDSEMNASRTSVATGRRRRRRRRSTGKSTKPPVAADSPSNTSRRGSSSNVMKKAAAMGRSGSSSALNSRSINPLMPRDDKLMMSNHMSMDRLDFDPAMMYRERQDSSQLFGSTQQFDSNQNLDEFKDWAQKALSGVKNPRRRLTKRPSGFSNMKLRGGASNTSLDGSVHSRDSSQGSMQNQTWATTNIPRAPSSSGLSKNMLENFGRDAATRRRISSQMLNSLGKDAVARNRSSGALSKQMLNSVGRDKMSGSGGMTRNSSSDALSTRMLNNLGKDAVARNKSSGALSKQMLNSVGKDKISGSGGMTRNSSSDALSTRMLNNLGKDGIPNGGGLPTSGSSTRLSRVSSTEGLGYTMGGKGARRNSNTNLSLASGNESWHGFDLDDEDGDNNNNNGVPASTGHKRRGRRTRRSSGHAGMDRPKKIDGSGNY